MFVSLFSLILCNWFCIRIQQYNYDQQVYYKVALFVLFSWPGRSPERATVLPPALALASASALAAAVALAKSLMLKFFM